MSTAFQRGVVLFNQNRYDLADREFRRELASFLVHARRAERGRRRRPARGPSGRGRSGDIRAWARDAGIQVSDRGRIPASVVAQYHAATSGP